MYLQNSQISPNSSKFCSFLAKSERFKRLQTDERTNERTDGRTDGRTHSSNLMLSYTKSPFGAINSEFLKISKFRVFLNSNIFKLMTNSNIWSKVSSIKVLFGGMFFFLVSIPMVQLIFHSSRKPL